MIPKDSLLGNRITIVSILFLLALTSEGQYNGKKSLEGFLDTQFWLGLKVGVNYTQAFPETRNSGFSPIDYSSDSLQKNYDDFALPGAHVGLEMNFYHKGFSISFQPAYKRSRYQYNSMLNWRGANSGNRFETRYDVEQRLDLIELPLMLKYDIIRSGKIRPFVMVGGFHSRIASAQKDVEVTQIDYSSGTPLTSGGGNTTLGVKDSFRAFSGISGGVGVNLDYWNIRTVFEVNYKRSLSSATRQNVSQNELASFGEMSDEVFLRDINISLGFVFPFRFINSSLKAF
ncbi:MAG: outer membrane beta-barrel protein [Ekhidna sp.]|nr:outer membrane beta-barrel protein [Ekhidna sp.]